MKNYCLMRVIRQFMYAFQAKHDGLAMAGRANIRQNTFATREPRQSDVSRFPAAFKVNTLSN